MMLPADLQNFIRLDRPQTLEDKLWRELDKKLEEIERGPVDPIENFIPFGDWIRDARPEYDWSYRHFRAMQEVLDLATKGDEKRIFFQVPIRHGKTEHNTVSYAVYRLELDPKFRWIIASYNQTQANKVSRQIRKLARIRGINISAERDTAMEWETVEGGGVRAVGSGAGVASVNADGIIIDDPIGSRDDAESQAERDRVWDWLTSDLLARTEPHTIVLMSMSRWHTDDPAGRLQERHQGRWRIVDLPGRAEANDSLGRLVNEPLWPEFRGESWHEDKRIELLEYGYASLVQGRPRPREGGMFKWDWWKVVRDGVVPACSYYVRYWDLAGTEPKGGWHDPDYSVGALTGRMMDNRTLIADIARFRHSVAHRDAEIKRICREDLAKYAGRITWWIETEAGIQGEERTQNLVRELNALGMTVYTEHPTGKKTSRAEPLASAAENSNVVLLEAAWNDTFRDELADFPFGKHDDQTDAASGSYAKLSNDSMQPARYFEHRV